MGMVLAVTALVIAIILAIAAGLVLGRTLSGR